MVLTDVCLSRCCALSAKLHASLLLDAGSKDTHAVFPCCSLLQKATGSEADVLPSLKTDLNHRVWVTRADALREIGSYIDDFDNTRRLHSTLGYRSPVAFEQRRGTAA